MRTANWLGSSFFDVTWLDPDEIWWSDTSYFMLPEICFNTRVMCTLHPKAIILKHFRHGFYFVL